jgi:biflaviolin synthase
MELAGPPADVMEYFITPVSLAGISELMGVPEADWALMAQYTRLIISSAAGRERSEQAKAEMAQYFDALAARRLAEPREDLLSHLAEAEREGRMSRAELVGFAELMQTSALNSVRFHTSNMVYLLLTHPGQLARLRADPELLPQAIEELLRFIPHRNAVGMPRVATQDVTIAGTTVRKGEAIYVSYVAANRDPECFEQPHDIDFDRSPIPHVAFGNGPHYCAGAPLARMEQQVMLSSLLERFSDLRLAVDPREIRWRRGELIRGPEALPVAW